MRVFEHEGLIRTDDGSDQTLTFTSQDNFVLFVNVDSIDDQIDTEIVKDAVRIATNPNDNALGILLNESLDRLAEEYAD